MPFPMNMNFCDFQFPEHTPKDGSVFSKPILTQPQKAMMTRTYKGERRRPST